ncbi:MAG: hypothetical protein WKF91_01755 [Segetibacter sp.]
MLRVTITLLTLALLSCNTNDTTKNNSSTSLSDTASTQLKKKYSDSLIKNEENKALGDINFGMSEKEVKKLIDKFKDNNKRPHKILDEVFYDYFIGNFEFSTIWDFYHNKKLYQLTVLGDLIMWDNYSKEVSDKISSISNVLSQKFGEPDEEKPIPQSYQMEKGFTYLIKAWNIGKKRIEVRIEDNGTSYSPQAIIFDKTIQELINRQEQAKQDSITKATNDAF